MRDVRRIRRVATGAVLASLAVIVSAVIAPAEPPTASAAAVCRVTDATLSWGFKASFRAYITSSIANGDWSTSGNAGYATPNFIWRKGGGTFSPAATSGQVFFAGGVRFTGHDGLLDSTFANPRLRFTGAKTAMLVVDYTGVSMADALAGKSTPKTYPNIEFAAVNAGAGSRGASGATTTFTSAPSSITAAGYAAFGSYPAGTALDPVTVSITTDASCGAPTPGGPPTAQHAQAAQPSNDSAARPTTAPVRTSPSGAAAKPTAGPGLPQPGIVATTGLPIPATAGSSGAAAPSTDDAPVATHEAAASPAATRNLDILASANSHDGTAGNGFLFGLGGVVVGVVTTLLIQFAHLHLLARRKAVRDK